VVRERRGAARAVVVGDAAQLQQALLNLAFNARDAMPAGGELTLQTAEAERDAAWCARHPEARLGPHLAISVSDTGHGIPADLHHRVFEPFFTTKATGQGTGLGLAIVYGIARAHGGGVDLESVPGHGATFTLSMPLAPADVVPARDTAGAATRPASTGRILVVDDDEVPRRAAAAVLRACGYEPVAAASAAEGIAWLEANPGAARAVLLDVAMPGMDGVGCLAALRRLEPALPVIFTSGYARDEEAQALVARGEAAFLPKPFDQAQLAAAVEAAARGGARPR
jgi:CheY-like chemotaxis protein